MTAIRAANAPQEPSFAYALSLFPADELSVFPIAQQIVGVTTFVSSTIKAIIDLARMIFSRNNFSEAKKDFYEDVRCMGIGLIRLTPILGTIYSLFIIAKTKNTSIPVPHPAPAKQKKELSAAEIAAKAEKAKVWKESAASGKKEMIAMIAKATAARSAAAPTADRPVAADAADAAVAADAAGRPIIPAHVAAVADRTAARIAEAFRPRDEAIKASIDSRNASDKRPPLDSPFNAGWKAVTANGGFSFSAITRAIDAAKAQDAVIRQQKFEELAAARKARAAANKEVAASL